MSDSHLKHPPNFYLVVDLEATCCDQLSFPRDEMETIEIGAVMVEGTTLAPIAEFQTFVQPVRHPQLTAFCTALTSITQAEVARAPLFPAAMASFQTWFADYPGFIFSSWGDYDRRQIKRDCSFHDIPYPMGNRHINLKKRFRARQKLRDRLDMKAALEWVGLPLEGTHHRGLDDARNIAKLLPYSVGAHQKA